MVFVVVLTIVVFAFGTMAVAQETTTTPTKSTPAPKMEKFHGAIVKVDAMAKTFDVKTMRRWKVMTFATTDKTKIMKGKEAKAFADLNAGMDVLIAYTEEAGTNIAAVVKIIAPKGGSEPPPASLPADRNIIQTDKQPTPTKQSREILEQTKINDHYSFRKYKDTSQGYCVGYEILYNEKVVDDSGCGDIDCSISGNLTGISFPPIGQNITGDGIPNLVVGCITGGSHCCSDITIYSLGNPLKVIKNFDCPYCTFKLVDLQRDGTYELIMTDSTFQGWAIYSRSEEGFANQNVILRYKNGDYQIAPDLMKKFPNKIDPPSLDAITSEFGDNNDFDPSSPEKGLLDLSRYMTALIYVGRGNEAFDFCHKVWPQNHKGEEAFIAAFKEQLAESPYWQGIKVLNGW
jgi:hypothetical protein